MSLSKNKTSKKARSNQSPFQLTFADELLDSGEVPDALVDRVLPSDGSVGLVDESASGKSLLASHLAACVATGADFFGSTHSPFMAEPGRLQRGGADQIPTFVALLGNRLEVTVIVDAKSGGNQRLSKMVKDGYLVNKPIIPVGTIVGKKNADIEDLLAVDDYLKLYNDAFKAADLKGTDPIVKQIPRHIGVDRFDHGKPADMFLLQRDKYLPNLSSDTLDNFQKLFETVNKTLGS